MIKLIVAIGPNNLIGIKNKMAWHIPAELKHFQKTTMGSWLLMGATTFKNLPNQLKGRKICVASSSEIKNIDFQVYNTQELKKFVEKFRNKPNKNIFIAGGKSIYENFYQLADELIISEVETNVKGDVYLNIDLTNYEKELIKQEKKFKVFRYFKT